MVLGATAAGLAAVLTFHTRPTSSTLAPSSRTSPTTSPPATSPSTTAPATPGSTAAPTAAPTTAPAAAVRSATGASEQYGYGQLQVRVVETGGRITAVDTVSLQTAESYSQQLAVQVIPMLRSEVLKAQSTKIYAITGATYTSEAYATSVQSALDKLKA